MALLDKDGGDTNKDDGFVRYARKELDSSEEQVYEYMDRTLQYRVRIDAIHSLKRTRKFSHLFARYAFFKAGSTQTQCQAVTSAQEDGGTDYVSFQHERRFAVDVNDAFVKYVSSSSLMLEVQCSAIMRSSAVGGDVVTGLRADLHAYPSLAGLRMQHLRVRETRSSVSEPTDPGNAPLPVAKRICELSRCG